MDFNMVDKRRYRNWAFELYPESAPENWVKILAVMKIPAFANLHDKDVDENGDLKKEHVHVELMFDGKKSYEQVKAITDALSATRPEVVHSKVGYARYLCHLDDPDKYQYDISDVICFAGADYQSMIMQPNDFDRLICEMEQWCDDNYVTSYSELARYARNNRPEWARILHNRTTVHMRAYVKSLDWEIKQGIYVGKEQQ